MGPVGAFYTRWLYALATSPAARRLALRRLAEAEQEQAEEEANRPPRLIYTEDHVTCTEVKIVDLPGVQLDEPLYPERVWKYVEWGMEVRLPDHEGRLWIEETEDGRTFPLEMRPLADWAQERTAPGSGG